MSAVTLKELEEIVKKHYNLASDPDVSTDVEDTTEDNPQHKQPLFPGEVWT
ncbi:MAG: hypothetical protein LBQ24_07480 [Candidatus Peribacteria bacterium]|jgi:hypothetical protein|nr:hypothetical protein [Candidatus Peribacteria bacterium]